MSGPKDTIFAHGSGQPPAAIAVVRVSGPGAGDSLERMTGRRPPQRRATLAAVRDPDDGGLLDNALLLWMPGPGTATGEDVAEFHLHGGRAVVDAVTGALARLPGLRVARPGEFTRRAFENGRIDLNEAEGLADLLEAETQGQRRAALAQAGGALSSLVAEWRTRLLELSAMAELAIDFSDEEDGERGRGAEIAAGAADLARNMAKIVRAPPTERLKDGVRAVIAGPPNVGKSSLFNALAGRDAAIASPMAGTTRDLVEAPVSIGGQAFLLVDTAGLRESDDPVEVMGIDRAEAAAGGADILLWLGDATAAPVHAGLLLIAPRCDIEVCPADGKGLPVSAVTGQGLVELSRELEQRATALLPRENELAINRRQREAVTAIHADLVGVAADNDLLIVAELLRRALARCDRLTGKAGVEQMLDALFGRFCVGK